MDTNVSMCLVLLLTLAIQGEMQDARIAFIANTGSHWDLFCWDTHHRQLFQLTETAYDENEARWSADRKRIAFSGSDGKLYLLNIATQEVKELVTGDTAKKKTTPCFSPDGKKIVYVRFKGGPTDDTELMLCDIETGKLELLIDQPGGQFFPAWSPDGICVVYTSVNCTSGCGRVIQELWITRVPGGHARQLLLTNSHCMQPAWSPDGREIAFSSDKGGDFDIWVLSLDDWSLKQITADPHLDTSPAWSPDGSEIAFISARSGKMCIWIKDVHSGKLQHVIPFEGRDIACRDVAW